MRLADDQQQRALAELEIGALPLTALRDVNALKDTSDGFCNLVFGVGTSCEARVCCRCRDVWLNAGAGACVELPVRLSIISKTSGRTVRSLQQRQRQICQAERMPGCSLFASRIPAAALKFKLKIRDVAVATLQDHQIAARHFTA